MGGKNRENFERVFDGLYHRVCERIEDYPFENRDDVEMRDVYHERDSGRMFLVTVKIQRMPDAKPEAETMKQEENPCN